MSLTAPLGFVAGGIASGVKESGDLDLALVATDDAGAVIAAATFTSNKAAAAPVEVSKAHLSATSGRAAAVVLNSGNANALTGADGLDAARRMCAVTARELGCAAEEVLVCSTGLIGIPFPIDAVEKGIPQLVASSNGNGDDDAAKAIMTTDTHPKQTLIHGDGFVVGGMAKGAAMLAPNMATMLAVLTTDAVVDHNDLAAALRTAVAGSFNRLSVDGCTSTNDTVIVLASGRGGRADGVAITAALSGACLELASQMAGDAEGATKVVKVVVQGAATASDAARGARNIAESQLTKCSWYGEDPYFGRIASDLGSAGIAFDLDRLSISYGGIEVCRHGTAIDHDEEAVRAHMKERHLEIVCDLGLGSEEDWVLTNDLTHAYVDENMGTS